MRHRSHVSLCRERHGGPGADLNQPDMLPDAGAEVESASNTLIQGSCRSRLFLHPKERRSLMNSRSLCAWLSCCVLLTSGVTSPADEPSQKPPEVAVVRPVVKELTDHESFTGRTEASTRVELRARITGYLVKVNFQDGGQVKQGDVLFEIDARPYLAQLDQARAQVRLAQAQLSLTEKTLVRYEAQNKRVPGSVSEQELDQARGAVVEAKARVLAQEASMEISKLNVAFTRITAPTKGRIGRRLIDPGNLVKADETILAVVLASEPMHVYFDIDERTFLRMRRLAAEGKLKAEKLPVALGLAEEQTFPHQGVVNFTDNSVDAQTGTIRMRAVLPNKDGRLLPGLFVRGRLLLGEPYKALLVPAQAVMVEEGLRFVLVVNDKNLLERRPVVLGPEDHGRGVVTKGLTPEDRVVVPGLPRLRPGTVVRPRLVPNDEKRNSGQGERRTGPGVSFGSSASSGTRGVLVEAVYPGASAQVVSDTVRAPLEQQMSGLEKLHLLRSRCTSDGKYVADLSFLRGADLSIMQVLSQNRVNLALPVLPAPARSPGITVRRGSSSVLMSVNLIAPDSRYDQLFLSNYAMIQIKDEVSRLAGVSSTTLLGQRDYGMRIWLDPDKLASCNLTANDVVKVLREQNVSVAPGRPGQPPIPSGQAFQYRLNTVGRLADPDEFAGIILKTSGEGRVIRLKDVARIDLGEDTLGSMAALDGKPVATLIVALTGEAATGRVRAALRDRLAEIRARLPKGLALDLSFDFTANLVNRAEPTTPEYLLLDVDLPSDVSFERTEQILNRSAELLRETPGIQHVLALSENPFDLFGSGPCLLVRLRASEQRKTSREAVIQAIRKGLEAITEMTIRVRDLSGAGCFPRCGYPIDFALRGPALDPVREWARQLGERLERSKKLTDVWVSRASTPRKQRFVEVDRQKAASLGVAVQDIFNALQVFGAAQQVGDINRFGRTWRVQVQVEPGPGERVKEFRKLKVRNREGQMVPLAALASVRENEAALVLDFLDGLPMLAITANCGAGVMVEEVRKLCETQAEEVRKELRLSTEYRLTWLQDIPGTK
jgi:RND family efflux transporter MFP subunit